MWIYSEVNATEPNSWEITFGSGNDLVPLGIKRLPEATIMHVAI